MGLFDKLKKLADSLPDSVQQAVEDISTAVDNAANQSNSGRQQTPSYQSNSGYQPSNAQPVYNAAAPISYKTPEYFAGIILPAFPSYQIEQNVSATRFSPSAHPACKPIDFLFSLNGSPVLAVALVKKNNYRGMNVIATKQLCENSNITYIRFYLEMENNADYVVNRIREYLA